VQELVEQGADVNYGDACGETALMSACRGGKLEIVKFLIDSKADVNKHFPDKTGWTALMHAAHYGFPDLVSYLVSVGADVSIRNKKGEDVYAIVPCMNASASDIAGAVDSALDELQQMQSQAVQPEDDDEEWKEEASLRQITSGAGMVDALFQFEDLYTKTCKDFEQEPQPNIVGTVQNMIDKVIPIDNLNLCGKGQKQRLTDVQVFPLFEVLGHGFPNSPFTTIDLSFNNIRNSGAKAIAVYLTQTATLTRLNLAGNSISQLGCQKIAQALYGQETLSSINFNSNPIGDEGVCKLAETLVGNTTLTHVDLGNTDMGVLAVIRLANMLPANHTLTDLNLDSPLIHGVMEDTTIHLAKAIGNNSTLKRLSLAKHRIKDHGANWIGEEIAKNRSLTECNLSCNKMSATGVAALAKGLANRILGCKVDLSNNLLRGTEHDEIFEAIEECESEQCPRALYWESEEAVQVLTAEGAQSGEEYGNKWGNQGGGVGDEWGNEGGGYEGGTAAGDYGGGGYDNEVEYAVEP